MQSIFCSYRIYIFFKMMQHLMVSIYKYLTTFDDTSNYLKIDSQSINKENNVYNILFYFKFI
jgi:hypothetical protein